MLFATGGINSAGQEFPVLDLCEGSFVSAGERECSHRHVPRANPLRAVVRLAMKNGGEANRDRNLQIARNEEVKQVSGSMRVSAWAIAIAAVIGAVILALVFIAAKP